MTRKRTPRAASTYRCARRNRVIREEHGVWQGPMVLYRPWQAKPPVVKHNALGWAFSRIRKQPKTYTPNGKREVARRLRQAA